MTIKIWDNHNKQWLEPMAIFFGKDNLIWRVTACEIGADPLSDGFYDLQGKDLKKIAFIGDLSLNVGLVPTDSFPKMEEEKEKTLAVIKSRIQSEYRKHHEGLPNDWIEIAAKKLYSELNIFRDSQINQKKKKK